LDKIYCILNNLLPSVAQAELYSIHGQNMTAFDGISPRTLTSVGPRWHEKKAVTTGPTGQATKPPCQARVITGESSQGFPIAKEALAESQL